MSPLRSKACSTSNVEGVTLTTSVKELCCSLHALCLCWDGVSNCCRWGNIFWKSTYASIDGRHEACHLTESKANAVWYLCSCILGYLCSTYDLPLDVTAEVVGCQWRAVRWVGQTEAIEVSRVSCCELITYYCLFWGQWAAVVVGTVIKPLISHIGMIEVDDRTETDACIDIITRVGCPHCLQHWFVGRVVTSSSQQA